MPYASLQPGETANLGVRTFSYPMKDENIPRGTVCVISGGLVRIAKSNLTGVNNLPVVVPVESKDNSGGSDGDLNIMVVQGPTDIVAVKIQNGTASPISVKPGAFLKIAATGDTPSGDGMLTPMTVGSDDPDLKAAQFISGPVAQWARGGSTPYAETISDGEVPEQPLTVGANSYAVGWVKLVRS